MQRASAVFEEIVVVDRAPSEYAQLLTTNARPGLVFHFTVSAEDALRLSILNRATWLVNVALEDMSGFELASIVKRRREGDAVVLVGDRYDLLHEKAARSSGRLMYCCKPPQEWWLSRTAEPCAKTNLAE